MLQKSHLLVAVVSVGLGIINVTAKYDLTDLGGVEVKPQESNQSKPKVQNRFADLIDSNTSQSSISGTYQDEDVLISFNRAYSKTDKYGDNFYIELKLKILADNKIIKLNTSKYARYNKIQVLDNFGNDLDYSSIEPYPSPSDSLRLGEEKLFTIKFSIKPLENTEYILLKIPETFFGNVNPFELKIVNPVFEIQKPTLILDKQMYTTEELDRMESEAKFERWQKENAKKREANKELLIEVSVVSLLVVVTSIIWLLVRVKRIRQFIVSYRIQIIIWIGILLIVLMCFFPPYIGWHIDVTRLCLRCGIVALIAGGLIYTFYGKRRD